ncbi:MAG: hypothetical protein AAFX44_10365 [Pseudomonadota bacterium]
MSNHYHLVVRLVPEEASAWTDDDVLERWTSLFRGPLLVQWYRDGRELTKVERQTLKETTAVYRARLASLSWFMKCLNEPIARRANAEDGCTGHFWEARFQSQPLCSEQALLTAMAYVDLNPVRAGIATTPEQSDYTSVKARLDPKTVSIELKEAVTQLIRQGEILRFAVPIRPLAPFSGVDADQLDAASIPSLLPMRMTDYLHLVDTTGRVSVSGKRGRIDPRLGSVLHRIGLTADRWLDATTNFRDHYRNGQLRLANTG